MVKSLIFILLLIPTFLFSGEFVSSVNTNQVQEGESFVLTLTLHSAAPKSAPNLNSLKNSFLVHSQQQSYNTMIVNGQASSSTSWKLVLIPQKEGEVILPPISIDTAEGTLSTQPLAIQVTKRTSKNTSQISNPYDISLTTEVTNLKPYKNEPFIYTIKLTSKQDLVNLKMDKLNIENTITEMNGEGKVYQKIIDGMKMNVIEISYLITPLKAGPLEIPPTVIQGGIPIRNKASFFDDNHSLFSMLQGFDRLKPFALETEKIVVDIQPIVPGITPWIPAQYLTIEETWDSSQTMQEGVPLTRGFKIIAEGVKANQLPSLNDLQTHDSVFKIYADQPETQEAIQEGKVHSSRTEQYTLIPQRSGTYILPEVSIAWWDVTKNEKVITKIPSKTLQIQASATPQTNSEFNPPASVETMQTETITTPQRDPLLYGLVIGLALLFLVALGWGIALQQKILRLTKPVETKPKAPIAEKSQPTAKYAPPKKEPPKDKDEKLPHINPT
ncbi:MAG: BatD family protein [Parachlamydiaceae bacterium]